MFVTIGKILYFLHRLPEITRTMPHSRSTPWVESKANRYTAYQSPLLMEEPSGFLTQTEEQVSMDIYILNSQDDKREKLASSVQA